MPADRTDQPPPDPGATPERSILLVPSELHYDPAVRRAAPLWTVLVDLAREDLEVEMPVTTLATVLAVSPRTLTAWRHALVAHGWLDVDAGCGRGNVTRWRPLRRLTPTEVAEIAAEDGWPVEAYRS